MAAMENWEAKTMRKKTKSIPKSLMLAKIGGQKCLEEALKSGEVVEVQGPAGCKTNFFAFTSFIMAEEKGISKRKKVQDTDSISFENATMIEDALTSMNIDLDIAGQEKEALSDETTKVLQDSLKSGNSLVGAATAAVMQSHGVVCMLNIHGGNIAQPQIRNTILYLNLDEWDWFNALEANS